MNLKNYTHEGLQQQQEKGKSVCNKKEEAKANTVKDVKGKAKPIVSAVSGAFMVVVGNGKIQKCSEDKLDVATNATTIIRNLNVETIEETPIAAINNNNINKKNSSEHDCNKMKRQQRRSFNESHSKCNNNNSKVESNTDVQIFTNTKEPNQVNLNSYSSSTTTSSLLSSSSSLSSSHAVEAAEARDRQTNLKKSHSTPAFKFVESQAVDGYRVHCHVSDGININQSHPVDAAMEASSMDVPQHEHFVHNSASAADTLANSTPTASELAATPITPESLRFGCTHYKRRAMFVTPCCKKFYKCRFCHDENESHHFDRKTLTELICSECNTRQKVQEQCEKCGVRFGKYTCLICNLFDDADKQQYHCHGCGICRIGGAHNFFHCEVCNMCLPMQLKIDGHRCVENISRSHCPVCLGDIHTSRIPCHIPDCGHLLHKMCFDQLLASGHYTCPTCQTSLIDMTALWEYLDAQALRMPVPLKYENQRVHIFCNDCHKTSKTKFHFIGLKCEHCGAYNTTQDVKRRMSLVTDEASSA